MCKQILDHEKRVTMWKRLYGSNNNKYITNHSSDTSFTHRLKFASFLVCVCYECVWKQVGKRISLQQVPQLWVTTYAAVLPQMPQKHNPVTLVSSSTDSRANTSSNTHKHTQKHHCICRIASLWVHWFQNTHIPVESKWTQSENVIPLSLSSFSLLFSKPKVLSMVLQWWL